MSPWYCFGIRGSMTCSREVGGEQRVDVDAGRVLRRDQHGLQADGPAALVVERDLRLAVGPEVGDDLGLADLAQAVGQAVGQPDRQGHEVVGLVAGVPEHHPLVAGALGVDHVLAAGARPDLHGGVDALGDVGRLLVDRHDHAARVAVEAVGLAVVADAVDRLADDLRDVDIRLGRDLAGDHDEARRQQRLARDPGVRVLLEDGVEDGIGDLVGHLVGMALGHGFGREGEAVAHGRGSFRGWGSIGGTRRRRGPLGPPRACRRAGHPAPCRRRGGGSPRWCRARSRRRAPRRRCRR